MLDLNKYILLLGEYLRGGCLSCYGIYMVCPFKIYSDNIL